MVIESRFNSLTRKGTGKVASEYVSTECDHKDGPERPFTASELEQAVQDIDPETAEVTWAYSDVFDPYAMGITLAGLIGRESFARSPDGDTWVWFGDLPKGLRDALWERHKDELQFPAGLPPA